MAGLHRGGGAPGRVLGRSVGPALLSLLLAAPLTVVGPAAHADPAAGVTVAGNRLLRDGEPFVPRGFNSIGLLAPPWCQAGAAVTAAAHFGVAELAAARAWGANTLRFQVSQRGLADPAVAQADRDSYLARVESGVALARADGFVVIVSLQDQSLGCGTGHPLPSAQSEAAWDILAPAFGDDPDVMFELFNEPQNGTDAAGWAQWLNGGSTPLGNQGVVAVGHQQLLQDVRAAGATNVVIADGASHAAQLQGMPTLVDSLVTPNVVDAVHPYYYTDGAAKWDQRFGYLTTTTPVIATEWNYQSGDCGKKAETLAPTLLQYLLDHDIGVLGHALDVAPTGAPYSLMTPDWTWTPTQCGTAYGGAGQVLRTYFQQQAQGEDSTPPTGPASVEGAAVSAGSVTLSWPAAQDDVAVAAYQVQRDGTTIGTTSDLAYTDSQAAPGMTYTYTVVAEDEAGNRGQPASATVTTPPDISPPSAPGIPSATANAAGVQLTWGAAGDDVGVAAYQVWRDGTLIGQTTGLTYQDPAVSPATTYGYSVAAVDAAGNTGPAVTVRVTTPAADHPPTAPSAVSARLLTAAKVSVTWSAAIDDHGVAAYRVMRDGTVAGTVSQGLTFTDTSAPSGSHSYSVLAVDTAGQLSPPSSPSPVATVNVPVPAASGLTGTYFAKPSLTSSKLTRIDQTVSFSWGKGAPATGLPSDNFSVRWTGELIPLTNGNVTFSLASDAGARMWVNGVEVINDWTAHALRTDKATVSLTNRQAYAVRVEYFDTTGPATISLQWSAAGLAQQVIPTSQLVSS
jgi:chitodextrinase